MFDIKAWEDEKFVEEADVCLDSPKISVYYLIGKLGK